MSSEPWIDFTDPNYWYELAENDLKAASFVLEARKYQLVERKCVQAVVNAMSGWYVASHDLSTLPDQHDLLRFVSDIGLLAVLNEDTQQFLKELSTLDVLLRSKERTQLENEQCVPLYEQTREFVAWLMES